MNKKIMNKEQLQELLNSLQQRTTTEDGREQPLGKYSRMAMENMHKMDFQRFMLLKATGYLIDMMYHIDEEAYRKIDAAIQETLEKEPAPR